MIKEEIITSIDFTMNEYVTEDSSLRVNAEDMSLFSENEKKLAQIIGKMKLRYEDEHKLKPMAAYDEIEEKCQISISTIKNTINGKIKPTRNFLYKFTVGLQMSVDAANELFELCGGCLREDCRADYITIRALEDKDDIYAFINDFQKYTKLKIELRNRES